MAARAYASPSSKNFETANGGDRLIEPIVQLPGLMIDTSGNKNALTFRNVPLLAVAAASNSLARSSRTVRAFRPCFTSKSVVVSTAGRTIRPTGSIGGPVGGQVSPSLAASPQSSRLNL